MLYFTRTSTFILKHLIFVTKAIITTITILQLKNCNNKFVIKVFITTNLKDNNNNLIFVIVNQFTAKILIIASILVKVILDIIV